MPVNPEKRPIDLALDLLVYAPVGLALSAQEVLPRLAERGRERVSGQIASARVVGQFAVQHGQARLEQVLSRSRTGSTGSADRWAPSPLAGPSAAPAEPMRPAPRRRPPVTEAAPSRESLDGDDLAIPGYDSLSASQVLPRLEGLAAGELEAVRTYEVAHRGRKTILGRVAQLQSAS